jgi:hypothetical protein
MRAAPGRYVRALETDQTDQVIEPQPRRADSCQRVPAVQSRLNGGYVSVSKRK